MAANFSTLRDLVRNGRLNVAEKRPVLGLHANALLRRDEWEQLDDAILRIVETELVVVQDLISAGLVADLGGLGTTVSTIERLGDMSPASVDMDATAEANKDQAPYDEISFPVPIIHKDFEVKIRQYEASRRRGASIDVTSAERATRQVRNSMEDMVIKGVDDFKFAGHEIKGFTTHPNRIAVTASALGSGSFAVEGNAYKALLGAMSRLAQLGFNGPYMAYLPTKQYFNTLQRQTDGSGQSELASIMAGLSGNDTPLRGIRRADRLTDGEMIVYQQTSDVIDLGIALDVTPVQWEEKGGFIENYKILTAMVPRLKPDKANKLGVVHVSGTQ